jgi:DNA invertase Pin-like site-specific DNA recombinase
MFALANNSGTKLRGGKCARLAMRGSAPRPKTWIANSARDAPSGATRSSPRRCSGKSLKGRPQLEKAIDALGTGTSANALPSEPTRAGSRQGDGPGFGRTPKLDDHQQGEALKRLAAGESRRAIARSYRCSHSTIGRLAGD